MSTVLSHALVQATGQNPARWMLFLHGMLGSGGNWRSFARRLTTEHPDWGAVLVDLRMHGASQGFAPPHTLTAAARDLGVLESQVPGPIRGVLGHSFGGKVALTYARTHSGTLENLWVLDANPGPRETGRGSETTLRVMELLGALPRTFARREDFIGRVTAAGFEASLAQWLAMNLQRTEAGLALNLDLSALGALLEDYFRTDLWPVLTEVPAKLRVDFVIGGRSEVFDVAALARLNGLARNHPNLHVHTLPNAGHWVHVEDPDGTYGAVAEGL